MHKFILLSLYSLMAFQGKINAEDKGSLPLYEVYQEQGQTELFIKNATEFVVENSEHKLAARICADLLLLGQQMNKEELIDKAKKLLILQYHSSLYAELAFREFKDADDYKKYILSFLKNNEKISKDLQKKLYIAYVKGYARFQDKYFDSKNAHFSYALLAKILDEKQYSKIIFEKSKKLFTEEEIACLSQEKLTDCINHLPEKQFYQHYSLIVKTCPDEILNKEGMEKFKVLNYIRKGEAQKALQILEAIPNKNPDLLYFQTLAELSSGFKPSLDPKLFKKSKLYPSLNEVIKDAPYSIELFSGRAKFFKNFSQGLNNFEQLCFIGEISKGHELTVSTNQQEKPTFSGDVQKKYKIVMNSHLKNKSFEFAVYEQDQILAVYSSDPNQSKLYTAGAPKIKIFKNSGPVPQIKMSFNKSSDPNKAKYRFSFAMGVGSFDEFEQNLKEIFQSNVFSSEKEIAEFLAYNLSRAYFPSKEDKDGITFRILPFNKNNISPEISFSQLAKQKVINYKGKDSKVTVKTNQQESINWPVLPVHKIQKMSPVEFMTLINQIMTLLGSKS